MEIEAKLDEDFIFYANFINTFLKRIADQDMIKQCKHWIYKLCTDPCEGIKMKRCRNMYLANLLICMHNNKLDEPFLQPPFYVDISDAMNVFGEIPETVEKPSWLNDTAYQVQPTEHDTKRQKGRTYFATKSLPNGQGAFAYIGISLTDDDWTGPSVGAGDISSSRHEALERQFEQKYREEVPQYELENILAKRKDPKERERVLTFYDVLLQNVADELDGKAPEFNETVEGLLEQLIDDLKTKNQFAPYEGLDDYEKRMELLMVLYDRIKNRRDKVAKREEILDDIEEKVMPHLFEISETHPDDEYQLPAAMWQQAIDKMPSKKQIDLLKETYPIPVVEKFIIFLAAFKEEIAERMHRRHERLATQMKKELKKESVKKKAEAEKMQNICLETEGVYAAVKSHWEKKIAAENTNKNQFQIPLTEHSRFYEELKVAALDTQKLVEEEAARGKFLAEQINAVTKENITIREVNDESIRKIEEANSKILNNIKRLNRAIGKCEEHIINTRSTADQAKRKLMSKDALLE
ncbi:uncharacterized protein LOC143204855 [Rhynchophorus ferrugineus]|uniref:DUF4485 domain-containing protein n=1 Tax=Rhynchophorus ferrugineus TaxID=354439 RepID=A0A834IVM9_RHYFE|nr:hypothetical protein GWI33_005691 [Rhynchophorus ferrugineus]